MNTTAISKQEVAITAKKRANGEGNIRKRKDGRWEGRYTAGHDPETGTAIYKNVLAKTQKECKEKLDKLTTLDIQKFYNKTKNKGRVKR